ncbi:MAG: glycosyltransferase family 4 protein [bacterium]
MTTQRILLLTDWIVKKDDWSFLREMLALGHSCETVGVEITRKYNSRLEKILYLWSGYFLIGLKGFLKRKKFDLVIAYQGVAGLFYSFFKQLSFNRRPRLVLMAFFFTKRKNPIYANLRYYFTKAALAGVDKVICYSSKESTYYNRFFGCKSQKFHFVPYGVNIARIEELLRRNPQAGDFIFSAGSSNRDYKTFFEAVAGLDTSVVVFAKKYNVAGLTVPDNVELKYDVYGDEYYNHLMSAKFVVVPLDDPELSSGQMVLLESMALGKAVIITQVWGVTDYVEDNKNALLVADHVSSDMRQKMELLLQKPDLARKLGARARERVLENFTVHDMARGVTEAVTH